ncbi:spore cortex biosynthesis protein YabQ [Halobacillus sp. Marseille-Q1614]|uniref:spore cortex biosynthesis protein YabQ n=1 Tax=Halobacillus sp. Marseille-Q1614 TaxID=2709134 RepID=UPI00156EC4B5|nr:spore cortex biosynthesis protein YabQ [Halobacillus sp. Marseille-Q1614]
MTLTTQFMTMISMLAGGVYIGAAIDTFNRLFRNRNQRSWLEFLWQPAFWISQAAFLFYILYLVNFGEIRVYVFVAILCGYSAYRALFQNLYQKTLELSIRLVTALFRLIKRILRILIYLPVVGVLILLKNVGFLVYRILYKGIYIVLLVVFTPLMLVFRMIWRLLPEKIQNYLHKGAGFWVKIKNTLSNKWKKKND